jgi:hypothetical protein
MVFYIIKYPIPVPSPLGGGVSFLQRLNLTTLVKNVFFQYT